MENDTKKTIQLWLALLVFPMFFIVCGILMTWVSVYIFHWYEPKWGPDYDFGLSTLVLTILAIFALAAYAAVTAVFMRKLRLIHPMRIAMTGLVSAVLAFSGGLLFGEWIIVGYSILGALIPGVLHYLAIRNVADCNDSLTALHLDVPDAFNPTNKI